MVSSGSLTVNDAREAMGYGYVRGQGTNVAYLDEETEDRLVMGPSVILNEEASREFLLDNLNRQYGKNSFIDRMEVAQATQDHEAIRLLATDPAYWTQVAQQREVDVAKRTKENIHIKVQNDMEKFPHVYTPYTTRNVRDDLIEPKALFGGDDIKMEEFLLQQKNLMKEDFLRELQRPLDTFRHPADRYHKFPVTDKEFKENETLMRQILLGRSKHKCSFRFVQRNPQQPDILQFVCSNCWKMRQRKLWRDQF